MEKTAFCIRVLTRWLYDVQEKVKCGTANVSVELYARQHYNSRSHSCPVSSVTYPTIKQLIYDRINSYHVSDIPSAPSFIRCNRAGVVQEAVTTNFRRDPVDGSWKGEQLNRVRLRGVGQ